MNASTTDNIPPIVLLVNDHPDALNVYDALLSRCGYWVVSAENGLEATGVRERSETDAIVIHVGLPGAMNGTDLKREPHADQKLRDVPVLAVTGMAPKRAVVAPQRDQPAVPVQQLGMCGGGQFIPAKP